MSKHALLSASGSSRWLNCPPSVRLEEQFEKTSSSYADEGTAAHALSELYTQRSLAEITEKKFKSELAKQQKGKYYNAEMREHAEDYAAFILNTITEAKANCPDAFATLEASGLDFSEWAPEGFGTCDCIIIADGMMEVIDFKYGKGVLVDAENNSQMRLYALGAYRRYEILYDIKTVRMTILQPRIRDLPSSETMAMSDLLKWADEYVKPRAALAFAGEGEFAPSDEVCKFCRARGQCKARTDKFVSLFDENPEPCLLQVDEAAVILEKAAGLKNWLTDLETFVLKELFAGNAVTGWKIVEGRSNRKYVDELQVAEAMVGAGFEEDQLYDKKLIGITAMEKLGGKKKVGEILKDLVTKPPGKPTLALESDKREAWKPQALILEAFDEVEE